MGLIDDARARGDARPERRIDYARMNELYPLQKRALADAVVIGDPEVIARACKKAVEEWNEIGAWPDDWSAWQRALDDALPWHASVQIGDL